VTDWRVPLASLVVHDEDLAAVVETYRTGWLTMGPRTQDFEDSFAQYVGARHAVAVSSGTAALHLICLAAGIGPGDEVIVPSLTFVATANAVIYAGASPVFADIASLDSPWLSAAAVEAAITPRTRAVLAMPYGGHAGEIEALASLCIRHGLTLLEDAAHAAGSRLHGRHLGTFGAAGAFSFFSNKNLAVGEGGVVVTDDDELAATVRALRSHGMTTLTWDRHRGHAASYDVVRIGYNYRLDEPRAAFASSRLRRLDSENARRAWLSDRYRVLFEPLDVILTMPASDGLASSHHLATVVLPEAVDRDGVRAHLAQDGIQTSVHYPPVHLTAAHLSPSVSLPATEQYARRAITLPLYPHLSELEQDMVVDAFTAAFAAKRPGAGS
jgi:dTDP-4-amino-4,6-dideoxygalactose transaminase